MTQNSALSAQDHKFLLAALDAGRAFEAGLTPDGETRFRAALEACAKADSTLVAKLSELAPKVSLKLGPKHLMGLLVPLERLSGRAARDEEFLFEERDGTSFEAASLSSPGAASLANLGSQEGLAVSFPRIVLCENIRSAFNVGAIFRTAEAFSATEIFLCGYTPDPKKTAMGADALVPSKHFDRASDAILAAQADGFKIVSLENSPGAIALEDFEWPEKTLLILGNERFGIDSETLATSDHVVRISATGQKNSINVGIAFGVAASRWREQPVTVRENQNQAADASTTGRSNTGDRQPSVFKKISPIGFLHGGFTNSQVAPRQGAYRPSTDVNDGSESARIELESRFEGRPSNFEQALQDLDGFERAWVVFGFHESQGWNPQVRPPRGDGSKRGLFATRSPHRPNGLGISCVRISKVDTAKRVVEISEHDLLNGTPIYDIKPYVPEADSFANAKAGWVDLVEASAFTITESVEVKQDLDWLEAHGELRLRPFIEEQLRYQPLDSERKRVSKNEATEIATSMISATIAFRTWRIDFTLTKSAQTLKVLRIRSGYSENEITAETNPYGDKDLHRAYLARE